MQKIQAIPPRTLTYTIGNTFITGNLVCSSSTLIQDMILGSMSKGAESEEGKRESQ